MGYLLSGHIVKEDAPFQRLDGLPKSISWRVFRQRNLNAFFIETFTAGRKPKWPFTEMPTVLDIPLDLPSDLEILTRVYSNLRKVRLANSFKCGMINLNLLICKLLKSETFTFCADDDDLDFICISVSGKLTRLHCQCGDLEIIHGPDGTVIQPLRPEFQEDEDFLTDVGQFDLEMTDLTIRPRDKSWPTGLHKIAAQEAIKYLSIDKPPLGLGTFDDPEFDLQIVASQTES
jgi:hypothetical protein